METVHHEARWPTGIVNDKSISSDCYELKYLQDWKVPTWEIWHSEQNHSHKLNVGVACLVLSTGSRQNISIYLCDDTRQ